MSSKGHFLITNDFNEEFYEDVSEQYKTEQHEHGASAITLEFSKENIRVDANDKDYLVLTITNVNSELYKIFEQIGTLATKEQK